MKETQTFEEKATYTPEEYLVMEAQAEYKSEFYEGKIRAMSGATLRHSYLTGRIGILLGNIVEDKNCTVFSSDLKIAVEEVKSYFYPDCTVICGEPEEAKLTNHAVVNPTLLVEILSKSTQVYDRGEKFHQYRLLPSFREYLLIAQDIAIVEVYSLQAENVWQMRLTEGLDKSFFLESLDCEIQMADLYKKIKWDQ